MIPTIECVKNLSRCDDAFVAWLAVRIRKKAEASDDGARGRITGRVLPWSTKSCRGWRCRNQRKWLNKHESKDLVWKPVLEINHHTHKACSGGSLWALPVPGGVVVWPSSKSVTLIQFAHKIKGLSSVCVCVLCFFLDEVSGPSQVVGCVGPCRWVNLSCAAFLALSDSRSLGPSANTRKIQHSVVCLYGRPR